MNLQRPPSDTPRLYAQDGKGYEATVHAHYFLGGNDWLVTEYDPEEDIAFGWACLNGDRDMAELGYVSLAELESVRAHATVRVNGQDAGQVPIPVEYEEGWTPTTITEAIRLLDHRQGRTTP